MLTSASSSCFYLWRSLLHRPITYFCIAPQSCHDYCLSTSTANSPVLQKKLKTQRFSRRSTNPEDDMFSLFRRNWSMTSAFPFPRHYLFYYPLLPRQSQCQNLLSRVREILTEIEVVRYLWIGCRYRLLLLRAQPRVAHRQGSLRQLAELFYRRCARDPVLI